MAQQWFMVDITIVNGDINCLVVEPPTPLKNHGFRQLGWWNSQLNGKIKHVCQAFLWFYDVLLLKNDDCLVVSIPLRYSTIHIKLLVGGAITILKNMSSSMGRIIPYIMGPWLVVDLPLWKIWKSVGIIIPNIWKNKTCLKPPTYGSTTLW